MKTIISCGRNSDSNVLLQENGFASNKKLHFLLLYFQDTENMYLLASNEIVTEYSVALYFQWQINIKLTFV